MSERRTANLVLTVVVGIGFYLLGGAHPALAQSTDVGYRDFNYGTGMNEPTADKPQSKLWFNDGIWWGSLWNPAVRKWEIHRFDWNTNTWTTTGTSIDARGNVKPDVLWDGTRLYIATAPNDTGSTDQRAFVRRYSYDAANKKYTLDPTFPAVVASGPMETIVLDKDTTGKLWVTFTQGSKVYVNRSLDSDSSWGTPFVPPALSGTTVNPDDISSVISFDRPTGPPQIGLMWSNQNDNAMYFATHKDGNPDTAWQPTQVAVGGPKYADDHISLRSLEADSSGRVFAAVKTSLNDGTTNPDDPLVLLLVLGQQNQWNKHVFGRARDNHTKPMVTIDQVNRKVYVFATGPTGTIYYKQSALDNISFPVGLGTPFIKSTNNINNVTSTKQNITQASGIGATGILVLASDNVNRYDWHNTIKTEAPPPSDTTPPETTIDSGPSGTVSSASASFGFSSSETGSTFQCSLDGVAFATCTSPKDYTGLSDGSHTFEVKATDAAGNTDATPATRSWSVDATAPVVDSVAPTDGATGVAVADNAEVTFSEAMDASTLSPDTFTLVEQGSGMPVASAVSYDPQARKAVLDPDADLQVDATYTATVETGAKDAAGNPLGADKVWSFATTSGPPPSDTTPPETTIDSGPSGTVSSASASFGFSSSETGSTFQCSLDGVAFATCTSPKDYTGLSDGSHTFEVKATDAAGNTDATPATRSWSVDATAPETTAPAHGFMANSTISKQGASAVLVELSWSATGTGDITRYELQRSSNGGAYVDVTLPSATATSVTERLEPGNAYQFRVRAQDQFGNWSAWQQGPNFNVGAHQESDSAITYTGVWNTQTFSSSYGGSLKYTSGTKSQQAKFTFFGSEVAWITQKGVDRGMADVYLDGTKVSTVDCLLGPGRPAQGGFFSEGLDPTVEHTLEVRALGTKNSASSGKRVDVDAFVVLR